MTERNTPTPAEKKAKAAAEKKAAAAKKAAEAKKAAAEKKKAAAAKKKEAEKKAAAAKKARAIKAPSIDGLKIIQVADIRDAKTNEYCKAYWDWTGKTGEVGERRRAKMANDNGFPADIVGKTYNQLTTEQKQSIVKRTYWM
jgi:hypothetical protein